MDFRGVLDRAADKVKSVFSRDNSFFYGTAEQEGQARAGYDQAPQQGVYPNAYQPQGAPQPPYQEHQEPYQQAYQNPQNPQNPWQQPSYAQAPPQQGPYQQQAVQPGYPPAYQQQMAPQAAYQAPSQQQTAPMQQQGFHSPQQAQLHQQAAQEAPGRNRRAAQHQQVQEPAADNNVVPFPGAPQPEAQEARQLDAYVVNITNINGCRQAMTCLRKGQCTLVVMDQLVDKAEVRRYVDMLNGACFALGGTMTRLSLKVGFYILAPSGMMVYTDPVTASANAQPRPQPAAYQAPQQPFQAQPLQQQAYAYTPQPQNYQQGGYTPAGYNPGPAYAPPQESYEAAYTDNRYAQ